MLLLNERQYLKVTKAIFKKNKRELIYEICYHFSWDVEKERAKELVFEDKETKKYICDCCGDIITDRHRRKISKLVEYINNGGRDDKVMTRLYKHVPIALWGVPCPGRVVDCGSECDFTSNTLKNSFGFNERPMLD